MSSNEAVDAYLRVSRKAGRHGPGYISPDVQRKAIEAWASYKGVEIRMWHLDEDESGGTNDRPGLNRARERCMQGETGGIVAWKIDRFSRTTEAGLRDLRDLQAVEARLAFVVEDIDTAGPMGKFVYTVLLAVAELFLDNIKQSWATSQENAFERGAFIGPTPFGFERITDKSDPRVGCLREHEVQGPVVREAFRRAAARDLHAAVDYLREAWPQRRWRTSDVRKLLAMRVYLGEVTIGSEGKGTREVRTRAHVALASHQDFLAAQSEPRYRRTPGDYVLSGIAHCGTCGGVMTGSLQRMRDGRVYRRMVCSQSNNGNAKGAGHASIRAELIEDHLRMKLFSALSSKALRESIVPDGLAEAKDALDAADLELNDWVTDTEMRSILGSEKYRAGLIERQGDVDRAREAYAALAAVATRAQALPAADELVDDEKFAQALAAMITDIRVRSGRGTVEERLSIEWTGAAEQALAA